MAKKKVVKVNAEPTKDLFIEMLVRDIDLLAAIIDLVDNSIDGAREAVTQRKRSSRKKPLAELYLHIKTNPTSLEFIDNCGGISLSDARNYAFRFGKHKKRDIDNSIGQFGVGMKRAFFKLGAKFVVNSTTTSSSFFLPVTVETWRKEKGWEFELQDVEERRFPKSAVGTTITIDPLLPAVAEEVSNDTFPTELLDEIVARHQEAINEGFELKVGEMQAAPMPAILLTSSEIIPAKEDFDVNGSGPPVRVRLVCGVGESRPGEAGWDVLCNGRTVLRSDQTSVTGWGGSSDQRIPSYHNQFARFRGFAYFDCTDASRVPWTTTKTGLDVDSPVWRTARQRMISMMRPVIDFLNALDSEHDQEEAGGDGGALGQSVEQAKPVPVTELPEAKVFKFPKPRKTSRVGRVSYSRPKEDLKRAKSELDVNSNKEVGELTFDYWMEAELD